MMRTLYCTALLIAALGPFAPVGATSYSVDNSDLYWNAAEDGWGMQLVQRKEAIFATLFVYDSANVPIWYTATLEPTGPSTWSGDLIVTSGPFFGTVPYVGTVTHTKVGTMTFTVNSDTAATVTYTVEAVPAVTKAIIRQTLRVDDYSGSYFGILYQNALGCPNPFDRVSYNNRIDFVVTQSGPTLSIQSQQQPQQVIFPVCQSTGSFTTYGQFASSQQVTTSCDDGTGAGNVMTFSDVNITPSGITMNFTAPSTNSGSKGCNLEGSIFGIRH
jgi:hypothetical protein